MVIFSAAPMRAFAWSVPDVDLRNPRFSIQVEWSWPADGYWSRFRLVRSVRSPVVRVEEGLVVLDTTVEEFAEYSEDGTVPTFRDGERQGTAQPEPGEWIYYTAFVLDINRIWKAAGYASEISPMNAGWSSRLPELLPGNSTAIDQGMMHPPDQASDVVQFLQGPSAFLDMLVSKAEAAQYFWDPVKAPPQAVKHIALSWGYPYSGGIDMARTRQVLTELREPVQGSLPSVNRISAAASGCDVIVEISNNLFLDVNDSSFEGGDIATTRWAPKASLVVRDLAQIPGAVVVPPNVKVKYCLQVNAAGKYTCGATDPVTNGIPIQDWTHVRTGLYGKDLPDTPVELGSAVDMGFDVYDQNGIFLQTFATMTAKTLTGSWAPYGFSDPQNTEDFGNRVPLTITSQESMPATVITTASNWSGYVGTGYASPQDVAPAAQAGPPPSMRLSWKASPSPDNPIALQGVASGKFAKAVVIGAVYLVEAEVTAASGAAQWRVSVAGLNQYGDTVTPNGARSVSSFLWTATTTTPTIGIEVLKPGGGWSTAGTHNVESITVVRQDAVAMYGVPWFNTTNPCYLDLIVVDDGR